MFKLIKFEFHKLSRSHAFYICTAILILLSFVSVYTEKFAQDKLGIINPDASGIVSLMEALPTSSITTILGIFIALFICEDYASGTIRNILTRGYSRLGVYIAKFCAVIIATIFMSFFCCLVSYVGGTYFWGNENASFGGTQIKILLYQLVIMLAYAALYFAVSSIIQKTGGSIASCIVLPLVVTILLNFADISLAEQEIELTSYWLDSLSHSIAATTAESEDLHRALVCSGLYVAGSLTIGWLATMKREY